jgi:hypothetical protein
MPSDSHTTDLARWEVAFVNWGALPATAMPPGWEPFHVTRDDEDGATVWIRRLVKGPK